MSHKGFIKSWHSKYKNRWNVFTENVIYLLNSDKENKNHWSCWHYNPQKHQAHNLPQRCRGPAEGSTVCNTNLKSIIVKRVCFVCVRGHAFNGDRAWKMRKHKPDSTVVFFLSCSLVYLLYPGLSVAFIDPPPSPSSPFCFPANKKIKGANNYLTWLLKVFHWLSWV